MLRACEACYHMLSVMLWLTSTDLPYPSSDGDDLGLGHGYRLP